MSWVDDQNVALLTDLYELTMIDAYLAEGLDRDAVFSLFVRHLPRERNLLLACGIDEAVSLLERLRFTEASLAYLAGLSLFSDELLSFLRQFRFTGEVHAVPEGTVVFGAEPVLEVVAPLPQAQLVETVLMNQVHLPMVAASKAVRVVEAARGRTVVDFGLRRVHGADAGLKVARASYVAGVESTSNVLAGAVYGIPVTGTMAHSYVQAHPQQLEAFRAFSRRFPKTVLLVDTYDTLGGVKDVIRLARERGAEFQVRAIRLDSGDLLELSRTARAMLDEAGLTQVGIFASGGLDEHEVQRLVQRGAPIQGFGVGTAMGVSSDAPSLDLAYKLVAYGGEPRMKLSPGKVLLPGQKQVFRVEENGRAVRDVLAAHDERRPGRPLLRRVMERGRRVLGTTSTLDEARARVRDELGRLPPALRAIEPAKVPYPVEVSERLLRERDRLAERLSLPGA